MKNITISIFAIIGFVAIISGFTNQAEQSAQPTHGTPESHVWKLIPNSVPGKIAAYQVNAVSGEVRFFEREKQIAIENK